MPRKTTKASATNANIIKININTKRKNQKGRRKPKTTQPQNPLPPRNPTNSIILRNDTFPQFRDFTISQSSLANAISQNSKDIQNLISSLSNPPPPPPTFATPPQTPPRPLPPTTSGNIPSLEPETRLTTSENPALSSQASGGGASGTSYQDFFSNESRQAEFRRLADEAYNRQIDELEQSGDLLELKRFAQRNGAGSKYNASGSIEALSTMLKKDDNVRRAYRGTYLKENPQTQAFMQTPPRREDDPLLTA